MHLLGSAVVPERDRGMQLWLTVLVGSWMPTPGQVLPMGHLTPPLHGRQSTDVLILSGQGHPQLEMLGLAV